VQQETSWSTVEPEGPHRGRYFAAAGVDIASWDMEVTQF